MKESREEAVLQEDATDVLLRCTLEKLWDLLL